MKNFTMFESRTGRNLRPLPFHTFSGQKWEVLENDGQDMQFFVYLTDALMYAENVDSLDNLSSNARHYWNMVAIS